LLNRVPFLVHFLFILVHSLDPSPTGTNIRFAATATTLLDYEQYLPRTEENEKKITLPCTMERFVALEQTAAATNGKQLKEEWRDRVLAATLDAFDEFPEIDKFAIQSIQEFEASKLNNLVRQLEIRMVQQIRELIERSVQEFIDSIQQTSTPMMYTTLHISSATNTAAVADGTTTTNNEQEGHTPSFEPSLEHVVQALCAVVDQVGTTALNMESLICPDLLAMLSMEGGISMINESVADHTVHAVIKAAKEQLLEILEAQLVQPTQIIEDFKSYMYIMALNPDTYWTEWNKHGGQMNAAKAANDAANDDGAMASSSAAAAPSLEETKAEIQKFMSIVADVESITETSTVNTGCVQIRVYEAKNVLCRHAKSLATALVRGIVDEATAESQVLEKEYHAMFDQVNVTPSCESELVVQRKFLRGLDMELLHKVSGGGDGGVFD
jgi:hypothetical protein